MLFGRVHVLNMNFAYCKIYDALSRKNKQLKKNKYSFGTVFLGIYSWNMFCVSFHPHNNNNKLTNPMSAMVP